MNPHNDLMKSVLSLFQFADLFTHQVFIIFYELDTVLGGVHTAVNRLDSPAS